MHDSIQNLINIENTIKLKLTDLKNNKIPKIIAVSKTFKIEKIMPLLEYGHIDYGENKVQEAIDKWSEPKLVYTNIKLHLIGKLQTNKVKYAVKLFDYIHSIDNEKLASKVADEQLKQNKKVKIFIQVNIGTEEQKSGVNKKNLNFFYSFCKKLNLDVVGLMCIPPINKDSFKYFEEIKLLTKDLGLMELSIGMSSDYIIAVENSATFLRIGSSIFGQRN
jgi:pyridoxal phosphate enzyme (YggS family)